MVDKQSRSYESEGGNNMDSRWSTIEEMKEILTEVNDNITKSGIPIMYDEDKMYIENSEKHSLIIGNNQCNIQESIIIPYAKTAITANESFIINDINGKAYEELNGEARKKGYNVVKFDFINQKASDRINPLLLAYKLYKEGKENTATTLLDNISYYLFYEDKKNPDPFWNNMCLNLFTSIALYLFETNDKDISLKKIYMIAMEYDKYKDSINETLKDKDIFLRYSNVHMAPTDTKETILSIFMQHLVYPVTHEVNEMLNDNTFDITKIQEEKFAIFLVNRNNGTSQRIIPMLLEIMHFIISTSDKNERRVNFILDNFINLKPIKDINIKFYNSIELNIKFTFIISSLTELRNTYGTEDGYSVEFNCSNIIYLLSNDVDTLEMISKYCGKIKNKDLISIQELTRLKENEIIAIITRMYPFRTLLK